MSKPLITLLDKMAQIARDEDSKLNRALWESLHRDGTFPGERPYKWVRVAPGVWEPKR